MRTAKQIQHDLSYLVEGEDATLRSFTELQTELLFDIREILLDMCERGGMDIVSFFLNGGDGIDEEKVKFFGGGGP